MNEKIIAANLFLLKGKNLDPVIFNIKSAQLMSGANLDDVLKYYTQIVEKKMLVAEVKSAIELLQDQKDTIIKAVSQKFNQEEEIVYVFNVEKNIKGLTIKVADNQIDFDTAGMYF